MILLRQRSKSDKGFSLWEILVVLTLMGVLLSGVKPFYKTAADAVRYQIREANIKRIEGAVELYQIDVGSLPKHIEDLIQCPDQVQGWCGPYLPKKPVDPFANKSYELNSSGKVIIVGP